jgi:putative ABC transport system permease protein
VDKLERVDHTAAELRAALGDGYEVHTWLELQPIARDAVERLRYVLFFVALILFLLVVSGIVNTMLMSVYERVREIGTMMAVGVRRRQVVALFLGEAGAIGLGGALLGAALGTAVVRWLGGSGIHLKPPGGEVMLIRPSVGWAFIGASIAAATVGALLAALYPAWKASRLKPVDALRAN